VQWDQKTYYSTFGSQRRFFARRKKPPRLSVSCEIARRQERWGNIKQNSTLTHRGTILSMEFAKFSSYVSPLLRHRLVKSTLPAAQCTLHIKRKRDKYNNSANNNNSSSSSPIYGNLFSTKRFQHHVSILFSN
jgi:hypothetical protein